MTGETNQDITNADVVEDVEVDDGSDLFMDDTETNVTDDESAEVEDEEDLNDEEDDSEESDEEDSDDETDNGEEAGEKTAKDKKSKSKQSEVLQKLKVRHLGKEIEIDPFTDDSKAVYQKGLDYDHLVETYANQDKVLDAAAKMAGVTKKDYLVSLASSHEAALVTKAESEIKAKYPEAPEAIIKELAQKNVAEQVAEIKKATEDADTQGWAELKSEYPELTKLEDLPKDAQAAVKAGRNPLLAMKDHELGELQQKVATLEATANAEKQNKKNRERSLGSARGTAAKAKIDPFVAGLES